MKKSKLLSIFLSTVIAIFLQSCDKDNNEENIEENISEKSQIEIVDFDKNSSTEISLKDNELNINFKSKIKNGKVKSKITIHNIDEDNIYSDNFILEKNKKSYKLAVFNEIERKSNILKDKLSLSQWLKIQKNYESFLKSLTQKVDSKQYRSDLVQSAFYHLSVYNTIIRSLKDKEDCECTPLPAYIVGESSFWCQEDYYFNVDELFNHYNKNKDYLLTLEGGEKEYDYINSLKGKKDKVSSKELFSLHHSVEDYKKLALKQFKEAQNNILNKVEDDCENGMSGSDLGCCGNYSGCCWYSSLNCLRHDVACYNCDKWHCGFSCEPEESLEE